MGGKVQGIRSISGRHKIDRGRLRTVWEMEKPKNLICTTHGHELKWGGMLVGGECRAEGNKGRKKWDKCNSIINKVYLERINNKTENSVPHLTSHTPGLNSHLCPLVVILESADLEQFHHHGKCTGQY